jgi:hypothetical protein
MQAYNVQTSDAAVFHEVADTPAASAGDGATFHDHAGASRILVVAAKDEAGFSSLSLPQSPAHDSATFADTAAVISDLGRVRRGDWAELTLSTTAVPDSPPVAIILDNSMATVATLMMPATTPDGLNFSLPLQISLAYSVGTFSVFYHYKLAGQSTIQQQTLEVVPGGDSGGAVISMYSIDRPEVRSLVAQLDSGVLVLGRSPSVKE